MFPYIFSQARTYRPPTTKNSTITPTKIKSVMIGIFNAFLQMT